MSPSIVTRPTDNMSIEHENNIIGSVRLTEQGVSQLDRVSSAEKDFVPHADIDDGLESSTVPSEEAQIPRMSNARIVLLGVAMGSTYFLGTATSTATTIMIPRMASDLRVSELDAQWIVSAYTLAYGCGLLFAGRLADMYGRKLLFISGLSIFCIVSIISASIRSRIPLCVIRALAGLGLAIASPAVYGIAGSNVRHEPARTLILGALGSGGPVGACAGTMIGGAITRVSDVGWTYLFYIVAGISFVPLSIGIIVIPRDRRQLGERGILHIDWLGGLLITAATSIFLFSLTQSGITEKGWSTPYIPVLLVISILIGVVFLFWERHLERNCTLKPVIKPSLFTRHGYKSLAVVLSAFFACSSVYGWTYSTTIYYQNVKGMSALGNAIHVAPANLNGILAMAQVLLFAPRVRAPTMFIVGGFLTGVSNLLLAVNPEGSIYWGCEFFSALTLPYGIDYVVGVGSILISNLVDQDEQSVGGAVFQMFCQIGGALGVCLSSLVSTQRAKISGSLITGIRAASWLNTALSWMVIVVTIIALRHVRLAKDVTKMIE
ncbi:major facilitator superfamily domain-containing protein [Kockovaella imperatae]|uniref:Major facilitator superfamily domain-containing protein n=1 Tax=Kockovaella imperatae TaxID=4999 RepID=A0A1Y1UE07_9TREE|nr:major facilitator superfamily domain-containing protein [Kockovaella imperatae]ORX35315.1 major facilitator superfamily domain-containing protein [Kockovaella imperatae]